MVSVSSFAFLFVDSSTDRFDFGGLGREGDFGRELPDGAVVVGVGFAVALIERGVRCLSCDSVQLFYDGLKRSGVVYEVACSGFEGGGGSNAGG